MSDRADEAVAYVRQIHNEWLADDNRGDGDKGGDVVIITHGHFSRVFLARWLGLPLAQGQLFTVDVGGVSGATPNLEVETPLTGALLSLPFKVSIGQYYHRLNRPCLGALNAGAF